MSFSAVGQHWKPADFREALARMPSLDWARGVTVHHTAYPDLSMRPSGWTVQHMRNLADYYGGELGWSAGPHLFTDESEVYALSPLTAPGVHAVSYNRTHIGIEMLGNYDEEQDSPFVWRGDFVIKTTAAVVAALLDKLGKPATPETVLFHRDDPRTSKTCPGTQIEKEWFLGRVREAMKAENRDDPMEQTPNPSSQHDRAGEDDMAGDDPRICCEKFEEIRERLGHAEWQLAEMKKLTAS